MNKRLKTNILSWIDLSRYLAKESTSDEAKQVEDWKDASSDHKSAFHQTEAIWEAVDEKNMHINMQTDEMWLDLKNKIESETRNQESNEPAVSKKNTFRLRIWMYSAAAVFLVGIFLMKDIVIDALRFENTIVTASEIKDISLTDGSIITLSKNSEFRYPQKIHTAAQRKVNLEGQAFFDVAKDPAHPFIISTSDVEIKVLGTSFNVKSQADGSVEVIVVTGKVALITPVNKTYDTLFVEPGYMATYKKGNSEASVAINNNANFLSWKTNKYVYNESPVLAVVTDISNHYDIDIEFTKPELGNCKFTGTFENNTVNEVLKILSYTMNLEYDVVNKTKIVIDGEGCGMN